MPVSIESLILSCARGCYQRALLEGREPWSGAGLRGRAAQFGARYARSRKGLVDRINAALPSGWRAETRICDRRRVLVVIDPQGRVEVFV